MRTSCWVRVLPPLEYFLLPKMFAQHRARRADRRSTPDVLVKAAILDGDDRLRHARRNRAERHLAALFAPLVTIAVISGVSSATLSSSCLLPADQPIV